MAKPQQPAGILAAILERATAAPTRPRTWFDDLTPDQQAELNEAKATFWRGEIKSLDGPMSPGCFASMLAAELQQRGISRIGKQGVENWLKRK